MQEMYIETMDSGQTCMWLQLLLSAALYYISPVKSF